MLARSIIFCFSRASLKKRVLFSSRTSGVENDQIEFTRKSMEAMNVRKATGLPIENCNSEENPNNRAGIKSIMGNRGDLLNSCFIKEYFELEQAYKQGDI